MTSPLTAHRQLRLGVARFANGAVAEAGGLLQAAVQTLEVRIWRGGGWRCTGGLCGDGRWGSVGVGVEGEVRV